MRTHRHRQTRQSEEGGDKAGTDRVDDFALALQRQILALRRRQIAHGRQDHQRGVLKETLPAIEQEIPRGQGVQHGSGVVGRRAKIEPQPHRGLAGRVAIFLHHRHQLAEQVVGADDIPHVRNIGDVRRQNFIDHIARGLKMAPRFAHGRGLRRMGRAPRHLRHQRHPDRPLRRRADQWHIGPSRIPRIALGHHRERQPCIADRAGVRPLRRHQLRADRPPRGCHRAECRNAPEADPQADDPVAIGRNPHGSADIIAMTDRPDPGRHRRTRAPRGAAGRGALVARVEGHPVQFVVRKGPHRKRRRIGPPDDDRPGMAQIGHHRCVLGRNEVLEGDHAIVGRMPLLIRVDLYGHGHAMQRAQRLAARTGGIGSIGRRQRLLVEAAHHGVELAVDRIHPRQARNRRLARRSPPGADQARQIGRIEVPKVHVRHSSASRFATGSRRGPVRASSRRISNRVTARKNPTPLWQRARLNARTAA